MKPSRWAGILLIAWIGVFIAGYNSGEPIEVEGRLGLGKAAILIFTDSGDSYYVVDAPDFDWPNDDSDARFRVKGHLHIDDRFKAPPGGGCGTAGNDPVIEADSIERLQSAGESSDGVDWMGLRGEILVAVALAGAAWTLYCAKGKKGLYFAGVVAASVVTFFVVDRTGGRLMGFVAVFSIVVLAFWLARRWGWR